MSKISVERILKSEEIEEILEIKYKTKDGTIIHNDYQNNKSSHVLNERIIRSEEK